MDGGRGSIPLAKVQTPLRIHVLDGAEEIGDLVSEPMSIVVTTLAHSECVVVLALDHVGRVTMYRQSEWLPAGYANTARVR